MQFPKNNSSLVLGIRHPFHRNRGESVRVMSEVDSNEDESAASSCSGRS